MSERDLIVAYIRMVADIHRDIGMLRSLASAIEAGEHVPSPVAPIRRKMESCARKERLPSSHKRGKR
jgi:hypothetical protein